MVVCIVLSFGLVTKSLLITQGCCSCRWPVLTQCEGLFSFPFVDAKEAGRGHSQNSWPQLTKGIPRPYGIVLRNKSWGKNEEDGSSVSWCLSSHITITYDEAMLSWRWLNTCLTMGRSEWIPYFAVLVHTTFASPFKVWGFFGCFSNEEAQKNRFCCKADHCQGVCMTNCVSYLLLLCLSKWYSVSLSSCNIVTRNYAKKGISVLQTLIDE